MAESFETVLMKTDILYIRQSKYDKVDWHSTLHTHYFSEVMYILSGKGHFIVENKKFPVKAGDMVVVNPYIQHTESSSGEYPLWYIVIGISNLRFQKKQVDRSHFILKDSQHTLLPLMKMAIEEMNRNELISEAMLVRIAEMIILKIIGSYNFSVVHIETKSVSKDSALIKEYIDNHYKENWHLDDLAETLHLDKYYMIHIFKKYFDDTPMNYLTKKRIENACELLGNTDYTVADIAYINGFSSQSYFNQVFRRMMYLSPNQYRKQSQLAELNDI